MRLINWGIIFFLQPHISIFMNLSLKKIVGLWLVTIATKAVAPEKQIYKSSNLKRSKSRVTSEEKEAGN